MRIRKPRQLFCRSLKYHITGSQFYLNFFVLWFVVVVVVLGNGSMSHHMFTILWQNENLGIYIWRYFYFLKSLNPLLPQRWYFWETVQHSGKVFIFFKFIIIIFCFILILPCSQFSLSLSLSLSLSVCILCVHLCLCSMRSLDFISMIYL